MIPRAAAVLVALVAFSAPRSALADIPPDPDSADAHCSQAEQCPAGVFCDYAFSPGQPESEWKQVGEDCRREVASKGLERRCRDGGNYGGRELYCPPGATGSWAPPGQKVTSPSDPAAAPKPGAEPPKSSASCAVVTERGWSGLLWLGGALWLARRRRGR